MDKGYWARILACLGRFLPPPRRRIGYWRPRRSIGLEDIPNPSGGFLGFWWYPSHNNELYLQIERSRKEARLCFKVDAEGEPSDRQEHLKWHWNERVLAAGGQQVVKPDVMRRGNTMTVAWWKNDWLAFGKDGKLNIPNTAENLKLAESVLKAAISSSS